MVLFELDGRAPSALLAETVETGDSGSLDCPQALSTKNAKIQGGYFFVSYHIFHPPCILLSEPSRNIAIPSVNGHFACLGFRVS